MSSSAKGLQEKEYRIIDFLGETNRVDALRNTFRKKPSATTHATASTANTSTVTSLDVNSQQDDKIETFGLSSRLQRRQRKLSGNRSASSFSNNLPPSTFVNESEVDEIEVQLKAPPISLINAVGPSIDSALSIDADLEEYQLCIASVSTIADRSCSTTSTTNIFNEKENYSNALFQQTTFLSSGTKEVEDPTAKNCNGIPKMATCHHRDGDEDIHSCITASTFGGGGVASSSSFYSHSTCSEKDDPENGPHLLSFHEQEDNFSGISNPRCLKPRQGSRQLQQQQPSSSVADFLPHATCDRKKVCFPDKKQQERSSRRKGVGYFMSKLINKL